MKPPFDLEANIDYTVGRFSGTIVKHGTYPCYIKNISNTLTAKCVSLKGTFTEKLTSESFDFSAIPLGNIVHEGTPLYLTRRPSRQWKQGISTNNLYVSDSTGKRRIIELEDLVKNPSFVALCLSKRDKLGEQPRYCRSHLILSNNVLTSHDEDSSGVVYYRGKVVGVREDKKFKLFDKNFYLKETMEALGGYVD